MSNKKLPWAAQETPSGKAKIVDALGFSVVNTTSGPYDDQRATAAFIVRAVNSHEQMKAALQLIVSLNVDDSATEWNAALLQCQTALAAAEAA